MPSTADLTRAIAAVRASIKTNAGLDWRAAEMLAYYAEQQLGRAHANPASECTGLTARWCPAHGDCSCPEDEGELDEPTCPLHGGDSAHSEPLQAPTDGRAYSRITHVAIRFSGTTWSLPKPFRHHHIFAMVSLLWRSEMGTREDREEDEQGFLDNSGQFLTRDEAAVIASSAGQIRNGRIIGGCLTSEDLW